MWTPDCSFTGTLTLLSKVDIRVTLMTSLFCSSTTVPQGYPANGKFPQLSKIVIHRMALVPPERRLALAMDACVATTEASLDTPGIAFLEVMI